MLVTSIFSVSYNVFKDFLLQVVKSRHCVVELILYQTTKFYIDRISKDLQTTKYIFLKNFNLFNTFRNKTWFLRVCSTSLLKTLWEKEKLLVTNNFSFSHSIFYPFRELSTIFINFKIVICKLFQFGEVQNLLVGKGLRKDRKHYWKRRKCWLPAFLFFP